MIIEGKEERETDSCSRSSFFMKHDFMINNGFMIK